MEKKMFFMFFFHIDKRYEHEEIYKFFKLFYNIDSTFIKFIITIGGLYIKV